MAPPKAEAPKSSDQAPAAVKPPEGVAPTKEQVDAKKKGIRDATHSALDDLKGKLPLRSDAALTEFDRDAIFNKMKSKLEGPLGTPFTRKSPNDFLTKVLEKLEPHLATLPEKDRQNAKSACMDKLFASFQKNIFETYPEIFVDGADDSIRIDITIVNGEAKILLNPADEPKRQAALKKIEDAAVEQAKADLQVKGVPDPAPEVVDQKVKDNVEKSKKDFEAKYPQGMAIVNTLCKGEPEKINAAFSGGGFLGMIIGLLMGTGIWETLAKNKTFGPYIKDLREKFDGVFGGVQEISKAEDFESFYKDMQPDTTRTLEKKFHTKAKFTLPVQMKVRGVQFKENTELRMADGRLEKFEADKTYENKEFAKGAIFPAETNFEDAILTAPKSGPAPAVVGPVAPNTPVAPVTPAVKPGEGTAGLAEKNEATAVALRKEIGEAQSQLSALITKLESTVETNNFLVKGTLKEKIAEKKEVIRKAFETINGLLAAADQATKAGDSSGALAKYQQAATTLEETLQRERNPDSKQGMLSDESKAVISEIRQYIATAKPKIDQAFKNKQETLKA